MYVCVCVIDTWKRSLSHPKFDYFSLPSGLCFFVFLILLSRLCVHITRDCRDCVCVTLIKNEPPPPKKGKTWRPRDLVATFSCPSAAPSQWAGEREKYYRRFSIDIIYQRLIGAHLSTMPIIPPPLRIQQQPPLGPAI